IERTLAAARISEEDRDQIRANKLASLDDMHELSRSQGRCFRRAIVRHFEPDVRKRIPIARKLLAWAFSERARRPKTQFCCEVCAKLDANVDRLRWAPRV